MCEKYVVCNCYARNVAEAKTSGRDWTEDESYVAFPRVTLCDMKVRGQDLGNVQPYTVQCVLPINAYNEKIYMFLWFWMIFVALASGLSLLLWLCRALVYSDRVRFIENHLQMGDRVQTPPGTRDEELARKFTHNYLRQDGALLLRLIAHNTDNITTTELVCSMWDGWKNNYVDTSSTPVTGTAANLHSRLYPDTLELNGLKDVKGHRKEKS